MKFSNKITTLCTVVFFLGTLTMFSQTYNDDEQTTEDEVIEIEVSNATPTLFGNLGINNDINPRNSQIQGNSLFLTQIGELNVANISTATVSSEINVRQEGTGNRTDLFYQARTAIADIEQTGDFNVVLDVVNSPSEDVSLQLEQQGDNLRFERIGVNSITKSLIFRQTEASPSLIIRSFN